jgi:putative glutamine amidotransferase
MRVLCSAIFHDFHPFMDFGLFDDAKVIISPDELNKDSTLLVWGGEDISPSLYGKKRSKQTWADDRPSRRDMIEWSLMKKAKELEIPIIGVCRGAQMLCAFAGGHLIQHCNNHAGRGHLVVDVDGHEFRVNSLHHQMMYPFNVEHQMVAKSKEILSDVHVDEDHDVEVKEEPEFVYFPKVKGIAIQWHPEMMPSDAEANQYLSNWLKTYYGKPV